jgi:diaminopimelate epimerase
MELRFVKMHGLGNDFMVVEWPQDQPLPSPERVRQWADRRTGVGFDSLLLVDAERMSGRAAAYRVFNADGGEAEQCGNGARCIARYLAPRLGHSLELASASGTIGARVDADGAVSVNLGEPIFEPAALPFAAGSRRERYRLPLAAGDVEFGAVSMGNPHAVIAVDSVETAPVGILGAELAVHPDFSQGVNVGFMERVNESSIRLRVYERGVGETRACGTGAAAAVAVARTWGLVGERVAVHLPGGLLEVSWPGPGSPLWQKGPTTAVYEGLIEL